MQTQTIRPKTYTERVAGFLEKMDPFYPNPQAAQLLISQQETIEGLKQEVFLLKQRLFWEGV